MFKIIFIIFFLLVFSLFLFENTKKDKFIVFGETNNNNNSHNNSDINDNIALNIIEKNSNRNPLSDNTSFNIELSNLFFTNSDERTSNNHTLQFSSQSIVILNTNIFSCKLEKIASESICLSLSACEGDKHCKEIEDIPNLTIMGKEPIYSFIASENNIHTKYVKLKPGEYEIIPTKNDVISSNHCNKIELDGVNFQEFTMGISFPQDDKSILCLNISDGCYGVIKNGETKICDINKVFIKNLM
jgi:hypothetical protein